MASSKGTSPDLLPYFNIDADAAMAQLGAPTTTARFVEIAQACAGGRDDLASRGMEQGTARTLRRSRGARGRRRGGADARGARGGRRAP